MDGLRGSKEKEKTGRRDGANSDENSSIQALLQFPSSLSSLLFQQDN